jgi:hypothetical protein
VTAPAEGQQGEAQHSVDPSIDPSIEPSIEPDVVDLMVADHDRISDLIDAGDGEMVVRELSSHLVTETQLVYHEIRENLDIDDLVDGWLDTDHDLETAALEIDKGRRKDLDDVARLFAAHRLMQESDAFVRLREGLDPERLALLGEAVQEIVRTAPTHPHPHNPDEGWWQIAADGVSGEIDRVRDHFHDRWHRSKPGDQPSDQPGDQPGDQGTP